MHSKTATITGKLKAIMQTINFNDTLNDQNVSTFVSSQEEAQQSTLLMKSIRCNYKKI
ncbi:hypothetical protein HNR74_003155 [Flammeovirga kamogawensis]|nr:hypothetical protein [Flammeovirga kamogawensis]